MSKQTEILGLAKKLISIKSVAGNKKSLEKALAVTLSELRGFTIERFERNGIKSALIYKSEQRPKKFKIILNGHLDVIPGKDHQYIPTIKGNKLYGVGSMDMKANVACLIHSFKEVAGKVNYPLALQLVTDEEVGGFDGTKYQVEKGVRADFVIAGEPTNFDIVHKAKGILWLRISTKGISFHGAYPWKGENAVWKMNEFLNTLRKRYPIPKKEEWITTLNLSNIETSNHVFNKIPDSCSISLDIRYISEESKEILVNIKRLLPEGFNIEIITKEPALFTPKNDMFLRKLEKTASSIIKRKVFIRGAQGSSDARHFSKINVSGVEFGPIGGNIGSDDEWVDIKSLEKYHRILKGFLLSFNKEN